jgi:hypothetical protein
MISTGSDRKPFYDDGPAGMSVLGLVPKPQQELLGRVLAAGRTTLGSAWAESAKKREIFWINLWQRSCEEKPMAIEGAADLNSWSRELVDRAYAGQNVVLDGYGFIINPVNSRAQPWHVDYTMDYSTIFIPLSKLTSLNATQYAVLPPGTPANVLKEAFANLDVVDFENLAATCDYISVRQLIAQRFSIIKMDFGTLHRGVANTGDFERVMFWISVSRTAQLLPVEATVEVIR